MAYVVVGVERYDFTNKDNQRIQGNNIYVLKPVDPRYGQGQKFLLKKDKQNSFSMTDDELRQYQLKPGVSFDMAFDENGRPVKSTIKLIQK